VKIPHPLFRVACQVGGVTYTADHVVIAVGGKPTVPAIPGAEHCITSDGFFALDARPAKVAVVGAGYIAVELAGIFNALESDTTLFVRGDKALRKFDALVNKQCIVVAHTADALRVVANCWAW
jgi:glutathione reductase (NADPH)